MAIIALRLLVLPGTEAICERCFSQLKLIHSHLRTKLKSDILDSILRIKTNLIWSKEIEDIQLYYDSSDDSDDSDEYNDISDSDDQSEDDHPMVFYEHDDTGDN